jgi:hypothetical protein
MSLRKLTKPTINIIKEENGNLFADSHNILNRLQNLLNRVLNIHWVHDLRQMEIHTAEPLVPEPSSVEVKTAI